MKKQEFGEAVLTRLEAIERQNLQILTLLEQLADSRHGYLPSHAATRIGKLSQEQYRAAVKDPAILRELSRQDTSRRRKDAMAARKNAAISGDSGDGRGKQDLPAPLPEEDFFRTYKPGSLLEQMKELDKRINKLCEDRTGQKWRPPLRVIQGGGMTTPIDRIVTYHHKRPRSQE